MRRIPSDIKWTAILVAIFIFTACGNKNKPKQAALTSLKKLTLTKNLTIPARVDTLIVGGYGRVVADHNKNIYGIDYQNQRILEFDDRGHFVRQIGREGAGPGEFRQIVTETIHGDTLYAMDGSELRVSLFGLPDASFSRSVSFPQKIENIKNLGTPMSFIALHNGSIGIHYADLMGDFKSQHQSEDHFVWLQSNRNTKKSPLSIFRGLKYFSIQNQKIRVLLFDPTGPRPVLKSHGNMVYFGLTDSLKITDYKPDGSPVTTYRLAISPPKITSAFKDSLINRYGKIVRQNIHPDDLGDVMPVYSDFWIDDAGRVWVLLENPFNKQKPLIVFKPDGTPSWKTMIPNHLNISCIRNKSVYGVWRDKDGMTSIVRFAVSFS